MQQLSKKVKWADAYQDWKASGLSRTRYYSEGRLKPFVVKGAMPSLSVLQYHFTRQAKAEVSSIESGSGSVAVPVVRLSQQDVDQALSLRGGTQERRSAGQAQASMRSVKVTLPAGGFVEFDSACPELFALQALKLGAMSV